MKSLARLHAAHALLLGGLALIAGVPVPLLRNLSDASAFMSLGAWVSAIVLTLFLLGLARYQWRWAGRAARGEADQRATLLLGGVLLVGGPLLSLVYPLLWLTRAVAIPEILYPFFFPLLATLSFLLGLLGAATLLTGLRPLDHATRARALFGALAGAVALGSMVEIVGLLEFPARIPYGPPAFGTLVTSLVFAPYGANGPALDDYLPLAVVAFVVLSIAMLVLRWSRGLRDGAGIGRFALPIGLLLIVAGSAPVVYDRIVSPLALLTGGELRAVALGLAAIALALVARPLAARLVASLGALLVILNAGFSLSLITRGDLAINLENWIVILGSRFGPELIATTVTAGLATLLVFGAWMALFVAVFRAAGSGTTTPALEGSETREVPK